MSRQVACVVAAFVLLGGCDGQVHTPLELRFPADGSRACAVEIELWIIRGGCTSGGDEVFRTTYRPGDTPRPLDTLPPGRYGFAARAGDVAGHWFVEGCATRDVPRDDGEAIVIDLGPTGVALDCGGLDAGVHPRDGGDRDAGGRRDAGTVRDAGRPMDAGGGVDAGPVDPCVTGADTPNATLGCNGPPEGPGADGQFGGYCEETGNRWGTCIDPAMLCELADGLPDGMCVLPCPPAPSFVSTGGCPTGSRCFTWGPSDAWCYPDCLAAADCVYSCDPAYGWCDLV